MEFKLSAIITRGPAAFVAFCPELGVASQGRTEKSALHNLKEATELYLEDEDVQRMLAETPIKKAKVTSLAVTT